MKRKSGSRNKVVSQAKSPSQGTGEQTPEEHLRLRSEISLRRPRFMRQESWRYRRVRPEWRKPKGIDSKMRLSVKGWPALVKTGYGGPSEVRNLHPSGLRDVLVHNVKELEKLNPKTDAARLASEVGARKRGILFTKAKELGIRVLNPRRLRPKA